MLKNQYYIELNRGIINSYDMERILGALWVERGTGQGTKKLTRIGTEGYYKDWEPFF